MVGPGPWQSVTQAQECFLCGRVVSQGLDCMHSGSLSPMHRWGDSRHQAPSSPCEVTSWGSEGEKVHVSFHSLVLGVQGTGIGGNQLDPKSLLPSALQRQPSYRLARARRNSTRQGSLCLLTTHLQMPPSNARPLQDFKAEQTRTGSVSSAL